MSLSVLQAVSAINDASALITALTPLVQQAVNSGKTEITDLEVEQAKANLQANIASLDALILKAKQTV
jgi:hypothetical protein